MSGRSDVIDHDAFAASDSHFGRRQLVWKYASTLRKKLENYLPDLIQRCRRRGYACSVLVKLSQPDDGETTS